MTKVKCVNENGVYVVTMKSRDYYCPICCEPLEYDDYSDDVIVMVCRECMLTRLFLLDKPVKEMYPNPLLRVVTPSRLRKMVPFRDDSAPGSAAGGAGVPRSGGALAAPAAVTEPDSAGYEQAVCW